MQLFSIEPAGDVKSCSSNSDDVLFHKRWESRLVVTPFLFSEARMFQVHCWPWLEWTAPRPRNRPRFWWKISFPDGDSWILVSARGSEGVAGLPAGPATQYPVGFLPKAVFSTPCLDVGGNCPRTAVSSRVETHWAAKAPAPDLIYLPFGGAFKWRNENRSEETT